MGKAQGGQILIAQGEACLLYTSMCIRDRVSDVGRFLQLAERYSDIQELDAATVNELIEKIVIHSPEKINGRKHVTIEIYFTYVGKIRIPLQKPELPASTEKPA